MELETAGVPFQYEGMKIKFTQPAKERTYNPDLILTKKDGSLMIIEIKGKLDVDTRYKHQWLKEQRPDLDIRMVFGNWSNKILKGSPTSYKQWAEKQDILCANKEIPQEWLEELE